MKKILYIIAALTAGVNLLQAQNTPTNLNLPVGAGIASPTATFHIHQTEADDPGTSGGVDLGEMNALLLQKVEELTLYIIDLQKQIDELKTKKQ